jgi:flagellar biogenesis protein FliO
MTSTELCLAGMVVGMLIAQLAFLRMAVHSSRRMQESRARIRRGEARIAALTAKALGRDV